MPTTASFQKERSELNALLASGLFSRAPSLENLLKYVCERHFEGHSEAVKEYNIAVEALGRPADFDQKRDSIVRVEAYRLRRRLNEYYSGPGAEHAVHILIPQGQYVPKFVCRQIAEPPPAPEPITSLPAVIEPAVITVDRKARPWIWYAVACGLALTTLSGYAYYSSRSWKNATAPKSEPALAPVMIPPGKDEIRILAGLAEDHYVDSSGRSWVGDRYFRGGSVFQGSHHRVLGALDPLIYQRRRQGPFGYDIPLRPGVYELRLHFAETLFGFMNLAGGAETSRVFGISINGQTVIPEFDVIADAGADVADIKIFKDISPAADGKLHLDFKELTNEPFINAIEILPSTKGHVRPLYLIERDRGYTDKTGRYWEPDHYARSGQVVMRTEEVTGSPDPELHRGERFGNLTYAFPVATPGRYSVSLRFAEAWFGPGKPAGGGAGSRVFDIFCNGVALARNFDIYKEAGGPDKAITRTFHNLEANHQGKLIFSMVPVTNYACVNAIEVTEEAK